ncbi:MAG TPA: hypothetical protein VFD42_02050, partial [Chloroflexota bacterium]|nr:hypothetical protein [Chloroflexota bacterium]
MDPVIARLAIEPAALEAVNRYLLDPGSPVVQNLLRVVEKYGTPEEINARARDARRLPNLLSQLEQAGSPYLEDLRWLAEQRDRGAFI